jgi:hypothetical protein
MHTGRIWPCVLGPVQHKGLDFVPMRAGLLLPIPVVIVLGFLCLPPRFHSSCAFVLVVTVFQLIRVVGEIEYLAPNNSLFRPSITTMRQFMWQDDLVQVAHLNFIRLSLGRVYTHLDTVNI